MNATESLLIGVDGGGTSTIAWLAGAEGPVLGRGSAGPSNAKAIGPVAAREALATAIRSAFESAGIEPRPVEVACLGLAGFDRPEDRQLLRDWADADGIGRRLVLVNDGEIVLAAGTPEGLGVAVISGTGSIAVGKGADGRTARAGGWGYLLGDEGSAYDVAVAGLRLVARRHDGRDAVARADPAPPPPALAEALCRAVGVPDPSGLVTAIYTSGFDRARIAALAPAVLAAATSDPVVRKEIVDPAGWSLAVAAAAVARAIAWHEPVLPLAMAGGFLLGAGAVSEAMVRNLARLTGREIAPTPVTEPVRGALALARRALS